MAITITKVSPKNLPINSSGRTIRVTGTNFASYTVPNNIKGITFNGKKINNWLIINPTTLEFGAPDYNEVKTYTGTSIVITDGVTPVTFNFNLNIYDNAQMFPYKAYVYAYHDDTLITTWTGEEAPWIQQEELMELVDKNGNPIPNAVPTEV